jgi:hypothetical protein
MAYQDSPVAVQAIHAIIDDHVQEHDVHNVLARVGDGLPHPGRQELPQTDEEHYGAEDPVCWATFPVAETSDDPSTPWPCTGALSGPRIRSPHPTS